MTDRSVGARYESHESEASQSSMFCCDNISPCFVVDLVCFFSLWLQVAVPFLNAARRDINLLPATS